MAHATIIGSYRILEQLGEGAMGVVYRARHVASERAVALKTVKVKDPLWLDSIRREVQALTLIRHPGVVRIIDHGMQQGIPWYAMDLLEGETLRHFGQRIWSGYRRPSATVAPTEIVNEGADDAGPQDQREQPAGRPTTLRRPRQSGLPPAGAGELSAILRIVRRMCATLAYLHGEGFINCDLKPENVVLIEHRPVLIDFGLTSYHPGGSGRERLEGHRGMAGTLPYMSPEQVLGEFVDARSDIYSIGCVLYELVTGRPPFVGPPKSLPSQHLSMAPLPPSELVSDLPPALERVILKLLEKSLDARFGYADEVAAALATISGDAEDLADLPPARSYLYRPRFVGREDVVARLAELRDDAAAGRGALVLVAGESGAGKTRVAMELTRLRPGAGMQVITGESAPPPAGGVASAPLQAVRPLLRAVADLCQQGGPETTARLLGHRRSVLAAYELLLAQVPGADHAPPPDVLGASASRARLLRYLGETLQELARQSPVMWMLDDLTWADELSIDFLHSLKPEFFAATPVLILGVYRNEEASDAIARLARLPHVTHLSMPPLGSAAVRLLVSDMLALPDVPARFAEFVAGQAEGNPFFVGEYLRAAVNERILRRDDQDSWQLPPQTGEAPDYETLALPRSLRELIENRLRRLTPAARLLGLATAVLGPDADLEVVYDVARLSDHTRVAALDELMRRQVLEQPEAGRVRFLHDKLREVAYTTALAEEVRELHARAAARLEKLWVERPDANRAWGLIGQHFAAAGLKEPAAGYLQRAGDHARATYANAEAIQLYRAAAAQIVPLLSETQPGAAEPWLERLVDIREALGDVLALIGRRDEARAAYTEAAQHVAPERRGQRARIYRKLGKTREAEHDHKQALEYYRAASDALGAVVPVGAGEARDEWIQLRIEQLWVYYWNNRPREMDVLATELQATVEKHGSPAQRARFFHTRALKNLRRDRYVVSDETLEFAQSALAACDDPSSSSERPMIRFLHGFVLLFRDALETAADELLAAQVLAQRAGEVGQQSRCLTYVTLAARRRGLIDETARYAERSDAVSAQAGLREYQAAAWANQAWVALQRRATGAAKELARKAWEIWRDLTAVFPFHWMALIPLVESELADGELDEAVAHAGLMLADHQHRLPDACSEPLGRAVASWASGDSASTRTSLDFALVNLKLGGYR